MTQRLSILFATALLSGRQLVPGRNRFAFFRRETRGIAIAVAVQASRVVAFMFRVGQHLGFRGIQLCVVTTLLARLTGGDVPLAFCGGCLSGFRRSEFGVVTLVPAVLAILRVALMFRGGHFARFRRRQLGMIAKANTVFAVGQIGLAPGCGYFSGFRLG